MFSIIWTLNFIGNNLNIGGTLSVKGHTNLSGGLTINGNANITGTLNFYDPDGSNFPSGIHVLS